MESIFLASHRVPVSSLAHKNKGVLDARSVRSKRPVCSKLTSLMSAHRERRIEKSKDVHHCSGAAGILGCIQLNFRDI